MTTTETHKFKRGQKRHIHDINIMRDIADGDWWAIPDPFDNCNANDNEVIITEDIIIKITVIRIQPEKRKVNKL